MTDFGKYGQCGKERADEYAKCLDLEEKWQIALRICRHLSRLLTGADATNSPA